MSRTVSQSWHVSATRPALALRLCSDRGDGGPFGSGSIVIMRDPDGGWINASIYRVQVHGPKPPRFHSRLPLRAATIWQNLEAAGVMGVVGTWQHVSHLMTVIALKHRYDSHAKRAALITCRRGA
jgi:3-polyprenyl-4-hydroxybenzoate decarboxylase